MSDERGACCGCFDPLARRTFLLSMAAAIAAACAGPTRDAAARRERDLLDQAAELSRRAAVDLHSHPGPFAGRAAFPGASRELGPALADMRQARLDAALFSLPTDRPVIRNEPGTGTRQFREPEPGELFRFAETHFDTILGAMIGVVARSPGDVELLKAATPGLSGWSTSTTRPLVIGQELAGTWGELMKVDLRWVPIGPHPFHQRAGDPSPW